MHSNHPDEGAPSVSAPTKDEVAAARTLLALDEQERLRACTEEVREVLARYGMRLDVTAPEIVITPDLRTDPESAPEV